MRVKHPVHHWLSIRVRVLCVLVFCVSTLLPPYVPKDALAANTDDYAQPAEPQFLLVEDGFLMKSSSLTKGSRLAYTQGISYIVVAGDTLPKIAQKFNISEDTIRWANRLDVGTPIKPGQDLIILPVNGVLHTVTKGQTVSRIAELYGIASADIIRQNQLQGGYILPGQQLIIPGAKPIVAKPVEVAVVPPGKTPVVKPQQGKTAPSKPSQGGAPAQAIAADPTEGTFQMPCNNCQFTQYYNPGHEAVDIQTRGGGPVFAAEDGTVIRADYGWNGGYGNVIEIDHGNGVVTLYGHSKELYVKVGDKVKRGQEISWMGNTGRVYGATGIHVHFEVRVNGVKKNPLLYLQ